VGGGESDFVSYGLIRRSRTSRVHLPRPVVTVPIYGNALVGVLLNPDNANLPGSCTCRERLELFKRWFAVSNNGMGQVLDDRTALAARGDLPILQTGTFKVS